MKVFVSWSGELSCKIAELLKKWLPCIIQSVDVFFSPEDIEKGDNWDKTISSELSKCNYGIICLTSDNTMAPWINFEAGAIAKTLDSKITALMVNVKPSDIKGPLSRYQATKFEKNDFFQLISEINKAQEISLEQSILQNTFDTMWNSLEKEANSIIEKYSSTQSNQSENKDSIENAPLEEILQLLRTQNSILTNPEKLLPLNYLEFTQRHLQDINRESITANEMILKEIIYYMNNVLEGIEMLSNESLFIEFFRMMRFEELLNILEKNVKSNRSKTLYKMLFNLEQKYFEIMSKKKKNISNMDDSKKIVNYTK